MKRILTLAACAVLFAGCDFAGGSDGPMTSVANVTLTAAPLQRAGGGSWDTDGAPDLYVEVQDVSGRAYYSSDVFENTEALPAGGLDLGGAFDLPGTSRSYFLVVIDVDDDQNELMAISEAFSADDLAASTSETVEIASENGSIGAVLQVSR